MPWRPGQQGAQHGILSSPFPVEVREHPLDSAPADGRGVAPGKRGEYPCTVRSNVQGAPSAAIPSPVVVGRALQPATERGISHWLLSLTHTDLDAIAQVIAQ
jgi:hypothetical protein